jgi:hypothetical protein
MIDIANCLADSWHRLGFQDAADMAAATWLTPDELYQYADDAAKLLARTTALFLTYDASIGANVGQSTYALPAGHVFTESAWLNYGVSTQQLRPTSAAELWALDATWPATNGYTTRISFDAADVGHAVLYPIPAAGGALLAQVMGVVPPTITSAASGLQVPEVVQDYVSMGMVAGARSKESDSAMPEVAAHLAERMKMLDAVFQSYWGTGR